MILGDPSDMADPTNHDVLVPADQQPIQRVVGRRRTPPPGRLPSPEARAAMTANAQYRTGAPKGLFFYKNHEEMTRDRERWTLDAMLARRSDRD